MFDIFKKRSEVVLDCFTMKQATCNLFPISHAYKFIPNWWKMLPSGPKLSEIEINDTTQVRRTMKHCPGVVDYYKKGIVIPMWEDLLLETSEDDYRYEFPINDCTLTSHPDEQHNHAFSHYHHIKIFSPWRFKCKEQIYFHWSAPFWNQYVNGDFSNNFHIIDGVIEFKNQTSTSVNAFVTKQKQKFAIECGTPLVYLFPNTNKKIVIKNHFISLKEMKKLELIEDFTFKKSYFKALRFLKDTNQ